MNVSKKLTESFHGDLLSYSKKYLYHLLCNVEMFVIIEHLQNLQFQDNEHILAQMMF